MGPSGDELGDVVGGEALQEGLGAGPLHPHLAHVRDVEQPGRRTGVQVLVEYHVSSGGVR